MKTLIEIIGWYGTAAIVDAYALNSFNIIGSQQPPTSFLTLLALSALSHALSPKAYQPATLNAIWTIIALIAILKIVF